MAWQNIFKDCYTGTDFENRVAEFLKALSFEVRRLGKSDGGVDIIATTTTKPTVYSFNIQCKYFNRPVDKRPIQEVYTGTNYYGNDAQPVVITNNHVTAEARIYAKRVGVEIIADAEWQEIEQVYKAKKIINPNPHKGLLGIIFWWLEVNGTLSTQDKVDKLYELMTEHSTITGTDYESITNRELTLNTKGLFPTKV